MNEVQQKDGSKVEIYVIKSSMYDINPFFLLSTSYLESQCKHIDTKFIHAKQSTCIFSHGIGSKLEKAIYYNIGPLMNMTFLTRPDISTENPDVQCARSVQSLIGFSS